MSAICLATAGLKYITCNWIVILYVSCAKHCEKCFISFLGGFPVIHSRHSLHLFPLSLLYLPHWTFSRRVKLVAVMWRVLCPCYHHSYCEWQTGTGGGSLENTSKSLGEHQAGSKSHESQWTVIFSKGPPEIKLRVGVESVWTSEWKESYPASSHIRCSLSLRPGCRARLRKLTQTCHLTVAASLSHSLS